MNRIGSIFLPVVAGFSGVASANPLLEMLTDWKPEWPERAGLTAVGYLQDQDYVVGDAEIMLGALSIPSEAIGRIENEVIQLGVKADFWILPFWNVHALVGNVEGTTRVTPAVPIFPTVEVDYDGLVYGVGTTLAYGQDWWWVSVTGVTTETELEGDASSVKAWLITPKIGVREGPLEAWIGATYQNVRETQRGTFPVPELGLAVYDIELEQSEGWNLQLGARYRISESLFVTLEGGFGERESFLAHAEWRFW